MSIARNLLIDHYRKRSPTRSEVPLHNVNPGDLPAADNDPASLGLEPDLANALSTLGEREREILALRYGADMTGPQIAEMTGLSLSNVQQIISRSLRRLRAVLEE